jgi:predicted PurR-regulated permease PerM
MDGLLDPRSVNRGQPLAGGFGAVEILVAVAIVAALYFGREVLMPVALAVLMSFVLAPLVRQLQRWYLPRIAAVFLVVLFAFSIVFALGGLMIAQVNQVAENLPSYQSTLRDKIQSLRGAATGSGTLEQASQVLQNLGKELELRKEETRPAIPGAPNVAGQEKPIPVEVRQPEPGALQTVAALIAPLIHPLATTGIVVIFVIFILLQRQDLRNRLVRLAGSHDLQRTTAAMDDAGQRLSRLFLTQLMLNAGFGLVIGIGLWLIGVPGAPLWGMMAMILRFVPYIGALIAAIFPLVLAAAVGPGWSMVVWTALLFVIVEPIVGHVIEPLVYGHSSGLSPVAVVASATFWTWLWGPIGLVLATPLTICLVVMGRHVERLGFLDVLLGDRPALTPTELLYQRLLAGDPIEAIEQAERFLKQKPLVAYYDDVLMGALALAQADAERGSLDEERMRRIRDTVAEIVDDLSAHEDEPPAPVENKAEHPLSRITKLDAAINPAPPTVPDQWRSDAAVLCIPGVGLLDEAVAITLAQLLGRRGIGARAERADALSMSNLLDLDTGNAVLICLCYLEQATPAQVRYAARRIRRKEPGASILVGLFREEEAPAEPPSAPDDGIETIHGTLADTLQRIAEIAQRESSVPRPAEIALPRSA